MKTIEDETEFNDHHWLPEWAHEEWWRDIGPMREDGFS